MARERRQLRSELIDAAHNWLTVIQLLGASVLKMRYGFRQSESSWLSTGRRIACFSFGNRVLIVDFKKSSSSSRRERMEKGYESQLSLYRLMLATGGLKYDNDPELAKLLATHEQVDVVYFTLNDSVCLTDASIFSANNVRVGRPSGGCGVGSNGDS